MKRTRFTVLRRWRRWTPAPPPGAVFEVNTGGMFRGYCGEPYPSRFLLEALRKSGARVTVNADAHCTEAVRFRFDETLALLRDIGFTAVTVLEDGMFVEKPL